MQSDPLFTRGIKYSSRVCGSWGPEQKPLCGRRPHIMLIIISQQFFFLYHLFTFYCWFLFSLLVFCDLQFFEVARQVTTAVSGQQLVKNGGEDTHKGGFSFKDIFISVCVLTTRILQKYQDLHPPNSDL